MSLLFATVPDSSTVVNFFISYNPYIFNHKYMNDTNPYIFDIQSIIFDYIKTVPLILNCFQHLKNERYFFVTNGIYFFIAILTLNFPSSAQKL